MAVSVTLPALGESVTEGTVTRWLKAEGERVEADEPLLEVSTDKVDTEIPSPAAGVGPPQQLARAPHGALAPARARAPPRPAAPPPPP
ncbi:biotin/lipoyl-containing protein, partial [Streptomyces mirabilis]|uniref:biotin/lipoyl-containing protein n=1 Tax=Streptomyces mirabilis TaxID=68239 RepID=UPI003674D288